MIDGYKEFEELVNKVDKPFRDVYDIVKQLLERLLRLQGQMETIRETGSESADNMKAVVKELSMVMLALVHIRNCAEDANKMLSENPFFESAIKQFEQLFPVEGTKL